MEIKDVKFGKTTRKDFSKVGDFIEMPNLIKVQKDSYDWFIEEGLGEVLKDISPIIDYSGNLVLEFFDYYMEEKTKYTEEEAKELAIKQFKKIGEKNLEKDKINIIKIDRNGEEYYYVTSAENTAEIKIKGGQITRINSASVTE